MWPSWITKAVLAVSPTPFPHMPGPGRSVSTKVATVYLPEVAAVSLAPQGSDWLKASTCWRLVSRSGAVPFWTTVGIANRSLAATTSPERSSSAQPLITCDRVGVRVAGDRVVALVPSPRSRSRRSRRR